MKYLNFYKKENCESEEEVFAYLIASLQKSISDWSYFVDWGKVKSNIGKVETELNILNSLIGKDNLDKKFVELVVEYPKIRNVLPILIATRKSKLKEMPILDSLKELSLDIKSYLFDEKIKLDNKTKKEIKRFFIESGLEDIFKDRTIKNLVDYCFGVEVGIDTNGRKNRGGHNMENIVKIFIDDFCKENKFKYLKEANAEKIKRELGLNVPVDKSSRRYDFVIKTKKELIILETNFYGSGGSKLKSTAGEYRDLFNVLNGKYKFIWITDGSGWLKSAKPLRETFNNNDYVFNLNMIKNGILEEFV